MRTVPLTAALAVALGTTACTDPEPTATLPVLSFVASGRAAVPLSGSEEVPPRATHARGVATFVLSDDGQSMSYTLRVSNIENVFAAHIHIGAAGVNGGVAVFLYGAVAPGGGRINSAQLASGTFTAADFIGPLAGMTMDDLVEAMQTGNAYVNVHTNDGIDPTNTGPGDFPGGEIRGQIR